MKRGRDTQKGEPLFDRNFTKVKTGPRERQKDSSERNSNCKRQN